MTYVYRTPTTLPDDSEERKNVPMFRGLLGYFPAALVEVARWSKKGNDKHNPGEQLHHARGKSMDHADCIIRHLVDIGDLMAADARGDMVDPQRLIDEHAALAWRSLALVQEFFEGLGAPLAPGARYPETPKFSKEEAIRRMLGVTAEEAIYNEKDPHVAETFGPLATGEAPPSAEYGRGAKWRSDEPEEAPLADINRTILGDPVDPPTQTC